MTEPTPQERDANDHDVDTGTAGSDRSEIAPRQDRSPVPLEPAETIVANPTVMEGVLIPRGPAPTPRPTSRRPLFIMTGIIVLLLVTVSVLVVVLVHGRRTATATGSTRPSPSASPSHTPTPIDTPSITLPTTAPSGVESNPPSAAATPSTDVAPSAIQTESGAIPVNLGDFGSNVITSTNGFNRGNSIPINAKTFTYGFSGCQIPCSSATVDINLNRSFSTLTARLGVRDTSSASGSARIQVIADGKVIAVKTVRLGVSFDVKLSVKNVLRLRFVESNDGGVVAAIGDPTVTP